MDKIIEKILEASKKYNHPGVVIPYGTAGFRAEANLLECIVFRVGIIACLRSHSRHGSTIGLMITASHNKESDNGVKIIDPKGEMMDESWESYATLVANADSEQSLRKAIELLVKDFHVDVNQEIVAKVIIARDTRPSGPLLTQAALDGVNCLNGNVQDLGIMTTPQLHFIVACSNDSSYGQASLDGYYKKLSESFVAVNSKKDSLKNYVPQVVIDCANGVGHLQMNPFQNLIPKELFSFSLVNNGDGILNESCGADFVKLKQLPPLTVSENFESGKRYLSFDGDADRIVYFYKDKEGNFRLLDGDKISTLICKFVQDELKGCHLENKLSLGLIQTAYANGSSTKYAEETLGVSTDFVPTGVKHLHHRAKQFDVGVYFEANGHGTVVFSDKAVSMIRCSNSMAGNKLSFVIDLINQSTGDAISDMLLIETILRHYDWSAEDWDATYKDLPSRQIKVSVMDRNKVQTTDAERKCTLPVGLQESIDAYVRKLGPNARCFVRPSGTEDIVRVYAESETQEKADTLAEAVAEAVVHLVNIEYNDK